jgi:hypothetical protein
LQKNERKMRKQRDVEENNMNGKNSIMDSKDGSGGTATSGNNLNQGAGQFGAKTLPVFFIQATASVQEDVNLQAPSGILEGKNASVVGVDAEMQSGVMAGADPVQQHVLIKSLAEQEGAVEEVPSGEDSSQTDSLDTNELEMALKEWGDEAETSKHPSAEQLVAIPEASREQSSARRSKCRVEEADEGVRVTAQRHKALRNEGSEHTCYIFGCS